MEFCFAGSLRRILLAGARCSSSVKSGLHGSSVYLSNISKSGDRGPRKNFNKKMKKNLKKTTEVDVTDLVSSLKTFEERGRIQAREQNEQEDENLKQILSSINFQQSETNEKEDRQRAYVGKAPAKKLFMTGSRLGIFQKHDSNTVMMPELQVDFEEEDCRHQVELLMKLKVKNEFEVMMEESDKMWSYPIDNEVCKENEENVGFEEHVLLDHLLKDFPQRGPVRRFMEMVITGLSRNPYYTVEEKHQQVQWYKDYFSKFSMEDLQAVGQEELDAIDTPSEFHSHTEEPSRDTNKGQSTSE